MAKDLIIAYAAIGVLLGADWTRSARSSNVILSFLIFLVAWPLILLGAVGHERDWRDR